jgi:hypothetical protein
MSALAKHEPGQVVEQPVVSNDPFLAMMERAWDKPEVLDKLIGIRNDELLRRAKVAFWADFAQMQPKLPTIDRHGKIEIREKDNSGKRTGEVQQASPYAYWADILEACSPAMLEHGFGISFRYATADDGKIIITGILSHRDGHSEESSIPLIHETSGSKNPVQAMGSSISYGMRYMGIMLLGVASKAEDDDGKGVGAGAVDYITDDQATEIEILLGHTQSDREAFLKFFKCETLEAMPREVGVSAVAWLKAKRDRMGAVK